MPANLNVPFDESCCDGGESNPNDNSARSCGCDPGAGWICLIHTVSPTTNGDIAAPKEIKSSGYVIKDSGKREEYAGGMVRDVAEGKINWALVADGPMLKRWAIHLTNGAKKYATRNWMKAEGQAEYERAKESAFRHFMQWYRDERDEDHGAAVLFNINECEYILDKTKESI